MGAGAAAAAVPGSEALLRATGLSKAYPRSRFGRGSGARYTVVREVDLEVAAGASLVLVGRSGAGKSTLARCLALVERPDSGSIRFLGRELLALPKRELASVRRQIQLIFQDPGRALSPRFTVAEVLEEPLLLAGVRPAARRARAAELATEVGIPEASLGRRPLELSGGQRQRLAIARALAIRPRLLIFDESLTGLDLSIQAQIVNLLWELQRRFGLSYVFVTHDLSMVRHLADLVAVMEEGEVVERGPAAEIFDRPRHPATRRLLATSVRA